MAVRNPLPTHLVRPPREGVVTHSNGNSDSPSSQPAVPCTPGPRFLHVHPNQAGAWPSLQCELQNPHPGQKMPSRLCILKTDPSLQGNKDIHDHGP